MTITRHFIRNPEIKRLALCKVGANRQRIFLLKENGEEHAVAATAQLIKEPGDGWKTAYVPVAVPLSDEDPGMLGEPGTVDVWEPAEIAKAAHSFLSHGGEIIAKHFDTEVAPGVKLVENAVALADFKVGETIIKEGTWYVGLEFEGEARRLVDSGEIDAVSVEGLADRVLAKEADADPPARADEFDQLGTGDEALIAFMGDGGLDFIIAKADADHSSAVHPDLDRSPKKNWIDRLPKALGLAFKRSWIYRAAKHMAADSSMTIGRAIATAVNAAKRGCATGDLNFSGPQQVNPKSKAEMCAAVQVWNAMKAHNAGATVAKETLEALDRNLDAVDEPGWHRLAKAVGLSVEPEIEEIEGLHAEGGTVEDMEISDRVEAVEKSVKDLTDGFAKLTGDDGVLAKLAAGQDEIAKRLPEPEPTEPTNGELKEALAKAEESIGTLLKPLADRIEALESGDSSQDDPPARKREPEVIAKNSSGDPLAGTAAGIFFD